MNREHRRIALGAAVVVAAVGALTIALRPLHVDSVALDEDMIERSNQFALDLYRDLVDPSRNLVLSPLSVSLGLAIAYDGAGGHTKSQIAAAMGFAGADESADAFGATLMEWLERTAERNRLTLANAIFAQEGFPVEPEFQQHVRSTYRAAVRKLDTGGQGEPDPAKAATAHQEINDWVREATDNVMGEILPWSLSVLNVTFLLVTATSFQGSWEISFDESHTRMLPFRLC